MMAENHGIKQRGIYEIIEGMPTTHKAAEELKVLKSLIREVRDTVASGHVHKQLGKKLRAFDIIVEGKE